MATNRWLGGAAAVAQVDNLTPGGTIEETDIFTVTMTGEDGSTASISGVAGGTTVKAVVEVLQPLLAASTNALFSAVTWTEDDLKIIGTAKNAGVPFYCSVATTETGGGAADDQTFVRSASVANVGPNDWNTATNWSLLAVPVSTNDIEIENSTYAILYGLDQSAVEVNSLKIGRSMSGYIGGAYTPLKLDFGAAATKTVEINYWNGAGNPPSPSTRINLSLGDEPLDILVHDTGTAAAAETGFPVRLVCDDAATVLTVKKGKVGIGKNYYGETATLGTINSLYTETAATDVTLGIGAGVTLTTLNQSGGQNTMECGATTVNLSGGTLSKSGSGAITTINNVAGTLTTEGSGAITTLNTYSDGTTYSGSSGTITTNNIYGVCDMTKTRVARTVTTTNVLPGGTYKYTPALMTHTNPIVWPTGCDVTCVAA